MVTEPLMTSQCVSRQNTSQNIVISTNNDKCVSIRVKYIIRWRYKRIQFVFVKTKFICQNHMRIKTIFICFWKENTESHDRTELLVYKDNCKLFVLVLTRTNKSG